MNYLEKTEEIIKKWRSIMEIDPIWDITAEIIDGKAGAIDISEAEYYKIKLLLGDDVFGLEEEEAVEEIKRMVSHEMTHLIAVDFIRTALLISKNKYVRDELRYRYEQFVIRTAKVITKLVNENERLKNELERRDNKTKKEML